MFKTVVITHVVESEAERFSGLADQHATNCLTNEPGCKSFEIVRDANDPSTFAFIETYEDESAFQSHLDSDHLNWWRQATADLFSQRPTAVRGFAAR